MIFEHSVDERVTNESCPEIIKAHSIYVLVHTVTNGGVLFFPFDLSYSFFYFFFFFFQITLVTIQKNNLDIIFKRGMSSKNSMALNILKEMCSGTTHLKMNTHTYSGTWQCWLMFGT